jgi:hypothetical protein
MTSLIASSLILAAVAVAPTEDDEVDAKFLAVRSTAFGRTYETGFYEGALAGTPQWDEDEPNPPVSARKAIQLAKKERDRAIQKPKGYTWTLEESSLKTDGSGWAWFVSYRAFMGESPAESADRVTLIVAMNGEILPLEQVAEKAAEASPPKKRNSK